MAALKVIYKRLKKNNGFAHVNRKVIEIDKTLTGKKHFEILIHEALHILYPERDEAYITEEAITLVNTLWNEGYRRVDNSNDTPLQDGTY
jgi:hypothetical protein